MPSPARPSITEEAASIEHLFTDPPATPTRKRRLSSLKPDLQDLGHKTTRTLQYQLHSAGKVDLEEEIAGWDWDSLSDYVPTPKKIRDSPKKTVRAGIEDQDLVGLNYTPDPCTRCLAQIVTESFFNKHILATIEPGFEHCHISLSDDWVYMDIHKVGDVLNIIGSFDTLASGQKSIAVTTHKNLLIHHPDTLLTPSLLASAPNCQRRPLVTALVRAPSPPSPALVYGTILHDVLQKCLKEKRWDARWIEAHVDTALSMAFGDLVRAGVTLSAAKDEILRRAAGVETFGQRYIGNKPKSEAKLSDTRAARGETALLAISSLHDVEEDIWSPTYGLRGKIDASVQATIIRNSGQSSTRPTPFEIKTGRAVAGLEHRAQTMLYTLLMQERYGEPVDLGLLYYTQSEEIVSVPVTRPELRALIGLRNAIAEWMARRSRGFMRHQLKDELPFLPPTIDDERLCGRCYALDACMLYRRAVENVIDEVSEIADIYAEKTGHLSQSQTDFFKTWERLITLEEQDMIRFRKELWTLGAGEREMLGRCFADMMLDMSSTAEEPAYTGASRIHGFTYCFRKRLKADAENLLNGHMDVGDAVTVSAVPDLFALCRGFILELSPEYVVLGVDHALDIATIQERLCKRTCHRDSDAKNPNTAVTFRIDKDEFSAGMGRLRENLASLFYVGGDTTRLRLVVDLAPPVFNSGSELLAGVRASSRCLALARSLNAHQVLAIEKVLRSCHYTLILGMPGTGKTTVVAHLIRMLVEMGKTVLLSAYTHSAVDTILSKLDGVDFGILRLGNVDKARFDFLIFVIKKYRTGARLLQVHPGSRRHHLSACRKPTTIEDFERQFMAPRVVATTALSIDQCVQSHFPAQKGGLDVSLFRRLSNAHPHAVVELTQQYRMNADIMLLSNKLIYNDRLSCGNQKVANQSLILPDIRFIQRIHPLALRCGDPCWIKELLNPSRKAIFVDTDQVPATESHVGDLVQNVTEAMLVHQFTECLLRSGIRAEQIAIVTLYRQQIKLLSHFLSGYPDVEILTADRSQGRDKDCIIISMVRSNDKGVTGDLVKDWRRMNVAFTRARSKLVIFGSRTTLARTPLLESFFQLVEREGWLLQLPRSAREAHTKVLFPPNDAPNRRVNEECAANLKPEKHDLEQSPHDARNLKRLQMSPDTGLLRGRPILRDVFNDVVDAT
ncbi:AAA domain-containing protein [Multifurca ochricompacta]|uniref:DNA replication ATP-dependent helicase/nuclease n=1 Tax=Multifurca ochricompacta TaxID=376703 RepID=A0AAD4QJ15_9AGAM|nr:AAA domain-containing protein [Multifurca ochricompacta]